MKSLFSALGKVLLGIAIVTLAFIGPVSWFFVDVGIWKKILSVFGL